MVIDIDRQFRKQNPAEYFQRAKGVMLTQASWLVLPEGIGLAAVARAIHF
jgi:hypothetical protein